MRTRRVSFKGFTIVEMMVVVAVIGILVGISSFGYRNWQQGLAQRETKSDLIMASTAMENAKNFGSGYPTSLPTTFKAGSGVTLRYIGGNSTAYCIESQSTRVGSVVFYIDSSTDKQPKPGNCGGAYVLSTPVPVVSSATPTSLVISWPAVSGASAYRLQYGPSSPTTPASCTSSPCTISGLASSTQYKITVTASSDYSSKTSAVLNASTTAPALRCDAGDTMSGTTCTKTYAATYNAGTSARYVCPSGGTLSGSECVTNEAYAATWVDGGGDFCNPPDTYYSPGVCQTPSGGLMSSESQGYTCPQGGTASGSTCYYRTYAATYQAGTAAYYSCPSGGTLSGSTCTRTYPAY